MRLVEFETVVRRLGCSQTAKNTQLTHAQGHEFEELRQLEDIEEVLRNCLRGGNC